MLGILTSLSLLSFNAAWEINQGKKMNMEVRPPPEQMRESYKKRLGDAIAFQRLSDEEKMDFVKSQLKEEEDRNEVNSMYKLTKKAIYNKKQE